MACATLKRPLEWTDPSMSPPSTAHNTGAKDSAHSYHQRAAKRRCLSTIMSPQMTDKSSHFGDVQPKLSSVKSVEQQLVVKVTPEHKSCCGRQRIVIKSSQSQNRISVIISYFETTGFSSPPHESQALSSTSIGLLSPTRRDAPLFTFRQVGLICERVLKERETQIRQEYDDVLNTKLAEQYETFVKFTYDQIQKRFEANSIPSYLS
ncbi:unnamed protein product [Oppiella nova]|uniref:Akirin n=1 Tax=Oppiella nova TaxID=334625 RepID=A0A7R9LDF3_9ACAR|nr:unnamed protein product [Oppiella nova]CAG2162357.1 unnamed protein product [Oppiella nova]